MGRPRRFAVFAPGNSRLSDVSVEHAVLDTFSYTSTTQLAPLRLKTQPLRAGLDGEPRAPLLVHSAARRAARRSGDPMSIRWARSPSPAYLNNGSRAIPKPSPALTMAAVGRTSTTTSTKADLRDRMRSASPFLQSGEAQKWGPKKNPTVANSPTPASSWTESQKSARHTHHSQASCILASQFTGKIGVWSPDSEQLL